MLQVKMTQTSDNPFNGKIRLKSLLNQAKTISFKNQMIALLDQAWFECKNSLELRQAFFIICFSIGDITNRQHNIFNNATVDNGGNAARPQMMWILSWIRKNHPEQYYKFMFNRIINEFISWFAILSSQVRTKKGNRAIDIEASSTYQSLWEHDLIKVAEYLAQIIKSGSFMDKFMLAKWLVKPTTSKRIKINKEGNKIGKRDLQDETKKANLYKIALYIKLSELMNWKVIQYPNNLKFVGLDEFRQEYNTKLESVLFSTKAICNLDKEQFFKLLNEAPSAARYRIQRRIVDGNNQSKEKWFNKSEGFDLAVWLHDWEDFKNQKQEEQRELTEKIRQGTATEFEIKNLEQVKKEAKVNTGASSLMDELNNLLMGKANDLQLQSIMDKIKFEVPVLVISDCSGSMQGRPIQIAKLLTTAALLKNPSPDIDNLLVRFGSSCDFVTDGSKGTQSNNRFMQSKSIIVDKIIDRTKTFSENFNNVSKLISENMGGTYFNTVVEELVKWIESDQLLRQIRIEQLQQFPVVVVVSDGDMNSDNTAAESMMRFMNQMRHYGWNGVVVVWDINTSSYKPTVDKFENVPNCIHYYGYNLGIINQIFTNIHDLDVIDVYQELKSLWLSNRYEPIKKLVD